MKRYSATVNCTEETMIGGWIRHDGEWRKRYSATVNCTEETMIGMD